jgi:hypothetical protein
MRTADIEQDALHRFAGQEVFERPARIPPGSSRSLAFSPHFKNAAPEAEVETLH